VHHPSFFVGIILRDVKLPVPNHGHVVLAKPSPILFYPISSKEVRCLVDVPGTKLPEDLPTYLRDIVAPEVPELLRAAFLNAIESGSKIRTMQNKQLYSTPLHQPGETLFSCAVHLFGNIKHSREKKHLRQLISHLLVCLTTTMISVRLKELCCSAMPST
jgi:squalene monooxygenase